MAQHLGLLWVAIEITTLSTAPLIYFNHNERALEAAWKYLVVCSVGIALALLGTFLLALSSAGPGGPRSLLLADLLAAGPRLSGPWVRFAFVFLLAGYGTKLGLAPFHAWKPDAYGEAPGLLGRAALRRRHQRGLPGAHARAPGLHRRRARGPSRARRWW